MRSEIKSVGWLFIDKGVKTVLNLTVYIYVARTLGPADFGILAIAQSTLAILNSIAGMGLDSLLVREFSIGDRKDYAAPVLSMVSIRIFGALISAVIFSIYIFSSAKSGIEQTASALICASIIYSPLMVFTAKSQAEGNFQRLVVSQSVVSFVFAIIRFVLAKYFCTLPNLALAINLESLVSGLLVLSQTRSLHSLTWVTPKIKMLWGQIRQGVPLMFAGLSVILYMRLDQFMIGTMAGGAELGRYSVATRFCELWYFIPMAIGTVVFPRLVSMLGNPDALQGYLRQINFLLTFSAVWLLLGTDIGLFLFSDLLFGSKYHGVVSIAIVYNISLVFVFQGVVRSQYIVALGLTRFVLISTCLGLIVNIALNIICIPRWGAVGAAGATVISQAVSSFVSTFLNRQVRWYGKVQSASFLAFVNPAEAIRIVKKLRNSNMKDSHLPA